MMACACYSALWRYAIIDGEPVYSLWVCRLTNFFYLLKHIESPGWNCLGIPEVLYFRNLSRHVRMECSPTADRIDTNGGEQIVFSPRNKNRLQPTARVSSACGMDRGLEIRLEDKELNGNYYWMASSVDQNLRSIRKWIVIKCLHLEHLCRRRCLRCCGC